MEISVERTQKPTFTDILAFRHQRRWSTVKCFSQGLNKRLNVWYASVCKCSLKVSASGYFGGTKDTVYDGILYASTNYLSFIDPNRRKPRCRRAKLVPRSPGCSYCVGSSPTCVFVGGQAVKVSGKDVNNALAFGKRHAHKVDLQVKDGNVAIGFNPNKKRPSEQRKSNSGKASEPPRRYVRMAGHSGLQGSRMGLYIEQV
eukprot:343354-Amorphochlora_amoeboformis.AAC.2